MIRLPEITLVAVDTRDTEQALLAMEASASGVTFGDAVLFGVHRPRMLPRWIRFVHISPIDIAEYSTFMIKALVDHVTTDFCLVVQGDGMVAHPEKWRSEFLDYDYIGAPWPDDEQWICRQPADKQLVYRSNLTAGYGRVGNGGFSLRSRRLLQACREHPSQEITVEEDSFICMYEIGYFLAAGIRFAPPALATAFSLENAVRESALDLSKVFGFHGRSNAHLALAAQLLKAAHSSRSIWRRLAVHALHRSDRWRVRSSVAGSQQGC